MIINQVPSWMKITETTVRSLMVLEKNFPWTFFVRRFLKCIARKNCFTGKNLQRKIVRLNFWRRRYWSTSGTFSKTFFSLTAILLERTTWWYLVCSAEILQTKNWDSVCWNHILAPSAQNCGSLRKTEQVSAMLLLTVSAWTATGSEEQCVFLPLFVVGGHHFRG